MPAAVQFLAVEVEGQMSFGIASMRIVFGAPAAAVPDHHRAAAVFALRDGAFERVVFDRMILDMDSETFLAGIEARAAGDGPAFHHAIELEPQIVV